MESESKDSKIDFDALKKKISDAEHKIDKPGINPQKNRRSNARESFKQISLNFK